jgi:hypothetical protein
MIKRPSDWRMLRQADSGIGVSGCPASGHGPSVLMNMGHQLLIPDQVINSRLFILLIHADGASREYASTAPI